MNKIPFIRVSGSHYDCGYQIGKNFDELIKEWLDDCRREPPEGMNWTECLSKSEQYLEVTRRKYPEIVEEIDGTADGAGVSMLELFATGIEELYAKHGCTDIIVVPPRSQQTWVAHNNDLSAKLVKYVTSVEWRFDDGTGMYTVGLAGVFVSVGVNIKRIVLSGNELTPNDNRTGIPRNIIARAILSAKSMDEAVEIATDPDRASSYNNIITTVGKSVSVEASATDFDILETEDGVVCHSNHYTLPKMFKYEGKPNYTSSIDRLNSAKYQTENSTIAEEDLIKILRSHGKDGTGSDSTICRHGDSPTLFSVLINVDKGEVKLCSGNPCENEFEMVWRI